MNILLVKPNEEPVLMEIDGDLASMQKAVGGLIEVITPYDDPIILVCNEEGKINNMEPNRPIMDVSGDISDVIFGDFFLAGDGGDDIKSIPQEYVDRYMELFSLKNKDKEMGDMQALDNKGLMEAKMIFIVSEDSPFR